MENIKNTPQIKSEAVVQRRSVQMCSVIKMFLEILQIHKKTSVSGFLFQQNCSPQACDFIKGTLMQI